MTDTNPSLIYHQELFASCDFELFILDTQWNQLGDADPLPQRPHVYFDELAEVGLKVTPRPSDTPAPPSAWEGFASSLQVQLHLSLEEPDEGSHSRGESKPILYHQSFVYNPKARDCAPRITPKGQILLPFKLPIGMYRWICST
jgi:hypothetical protein